MVLANIAFIIRKAIHSHPASHFESIINYDQTPKLSSSDQLLVEAFLIFCLPSLYYIPHDASFTPTTKNVRQVPKIKQKEYHLTNLSRTPLKFKSDSWDFAEYWASNWTCHIYGADRVQYSVTHCDILTGDITKWRVPPSWTIRQ